MCCYDTCSHCCCLPGGRRGSSLTTDGKGHKKSVLFCDCQQWRGANVALLKNKTWLSKKKKQKGSSKGDVLRKDLKIVPVCVCSSSAPFSLRAQSCWRWSRSISTGSHVSQILSQLLNEVGIPGVAISEHSGDIQLTIMGEHFVDACSFPEFNSVSKWRAFSIIQCELLSHFVSWSVKHMM